MWLNWVVRLTFESFKASFGIDYVQLALESCKDPDTCHNIRVINRKYSMGQKYLFEEGGVRVTKVRVIESYLLELIRKFSPCQKNRSSQGEVQVIESRVIESQP